jgi:ligand-binding sensor domain-containing protein/serine phosphatase RsbU (regulator of sigma subunit)
MLRPFPFFFFLFLLCSCDRESREVPFPSEEDEFPQPLTVPLKVPPGRMVKWLPVEKDNKHPSTAKVYFEDFKDSVFRLDPFAPLANSPDSHMVRLNDLPYVKLSFNDLKKQKVHPSLILLGEPEVNKAGAAIVESIFTKGLLELGQDQGLPGTEVHSIAQDKIGRLWLSTSNGICTYDGENVYSWYKKQGLSSDVKNNICIDKKGHVWAAGRGVDEIIPEEGLVRHYGKKEGLFSNRVVAVDLDSTGKIYISEVEGVDILDPDEGTCVHIGKDEGLSIVLNINDITTDKKGRIWMASNCGGVNIFDPAAEKMYLLSEKNGLGNNDCRSITAANDGRIWMGNWNGGVDYYDPESGKFMHLLAKKGLGKNYINHVMADSHGLIWISMLDAGLEVYDPSTRKLCHFYGEHGVVKSTVFCSFEDPDHRIWFGTRGAGLLKYDPFNGNIRNYSTKWWPTRLPILGFLEDSEGKIWLSTNGAGSCIYDPRNNTMKKISWGSDWTHAWQMSLRDDGKGNIYYCNDYNFVKYDVKAGKFIYWNDGNGLLHRGIRSIELMKDAVFLGSQKGLGKYEAVEDKFYFLAAGSDSLKIPISCMAKGKYGTLWLGTYNNGLYMYDPLSSEISHFSGAQGMAGNAVNCLACDHLGRMWVGTAGNGIKVIDVPRRSITTIDRKNGLAEKTIASLLEKDNIIYVGTVRGLSAIDVSGDKFRIKNYSKAQGFRNIDFNEGAAFAYNGSIWWGVGDMLTMYTPGTGKQNIPLPSITGIEVMEKSARFKPDTSLFYNAGPRDTLWASQRDTFYFKSTYPPQSIAEGMSWKSVSSAYLIPSNMVLPYFQNHLTFHFSGNYISNTDKTRYRYILEGLDKRWNTAVGEPVADYRNLPPGNYVFKVCSSNFGGEWSPPAGFAFTITPPWWKTGVAYSAYFLLLAGMVFGYNRLHTARLRQRQKELEAVVDERTKEIVEQKNEIALQKQTVEEKQKEIVDSINYAKRIQFTLLAHEKVLKKRFSEHFILFQPKDIVSGDFYWATSVSSRKKAVSSAELPAAAAASELFYLAVCDSTGHGVPGAFMSLLNISFLNEAINEKHIGQPHEILNYVRDRLVNSISRDGAKDGMDGALICFEFSPDEGINRIAYSAGNNPPMLYSNGQLTELPFNKMPIGKGEREEVFELHAISAMKGDILYLYTDGFADQFGGPKGKKFKYKQLNEIIRKNAERSLKEQKEALQKALNEWRAGYEQVDDICVIGIRL